MYNPDGLPFVLAAEEAYPENSSLKFKYFDRVWLDWSTGIMFKTIEEQDIIKKINDLC
jgi:hypothetical protein